MRTSKIILAKGIKMDKSYVNVLPYNTNEMLTLLNSTAHFINSKSNYSFIRRNGTISADFTYQECLKANYIAFQNPDYSNKWFFAFVDKVKYISDKNTEIEYTVDSWTTWYDSWTQVPSYVIREHIYRDNIGDNTVPENLDVDKYIEEDAPIEDPALSKYFYIIVATNYYVNNNSDGTESSADQKGFSYSGGLMYNRTFTGIPYIAFRWDVLDPDLITRNLALFIRRVNLDGHIADIHNIFVVPARILPINMTTWTAYYETRDDEHKFTFQLIPSTFTTFEDSSVYKIDKYYPFVEGSYRPKNKKCYCYPYNYIYATNNNGSQAIYKYEEFYNQSTCVFKEEIALSVGCSGRLIPLNYKNMSQCYEESLPLGKYPTCSWSSDAYTNWITQNAVNIPTSIVFSGLGALSSFFGGASKMYSTGTMEGASGVSNSIVSSASFVANMIGQEYQAKLLPSITGGTNVGDVTWVGDKNTWTLRLMRASDEFMKIIDNYFSRYGYKVNLLKKANFYSRTEWNYIEISPDSVIGEGDVPSRDMEIINNACRKGVTVWHHHANMGNFLVNNQTLIHP